MRKTTLLSLVLAVFCGTGIFHTSQKVHDEREKIAALETSISKEQESLRVLNAEWSYLNQPTRLEKLARNYLHLVPMKGGQFVKVENVPLRSAAVAEATPAAEEKTEEKKAPKAHVAVAKQVKEKPVHPSSLSPKIIESDDEDNEEEADVQTISVKAASIAKPPATTRNFNDLMKNLHAGIE